MEAQVIRRTRWEEKEWEEPEEIIHAKMAAYKFAIMPK